MLRYKGLYPYEFVTRIEKLNSLMTDLKRSDFDSKSTFSNITNEEWDHVIINIMIIYHVQEMIKECNIVTSKEWHDLYLKIDVYGLADVFEYVHREGFG